MDFCDNLFCDIFCDKSDEGRLFWQVTLAAKAIGRQVRIIVSTTVSTTAGAV